MKKVQLSSFKLNPLAAAITVALVSQFSADLANAGSGWGAGINLSNSPAKVKTYYANSPAGSVPAVDATGAIIINPATGLPVKVDTGKALRKFVDTLPGIGATKANNLNQYIPVAVAEKWVDGNGVATNDDYYAIAAVEFTEKMHSDLPKATHLRGYVQLMTPGLLAKGVVAKSFTTYDGRVLSVVDVPHHLGPIINASKGTAVRVKFTNYLPVGAGGNLFIPVDTTITGAGNGSDGKPYSQNRAEIHLVGGNTPWISAGNPHQWVAPVGEVTTHPKGDSTQNVPDMEYPGAGSTTLYFPNDISARFTFIQDRTSGLTRLNSYAGLEAAYSIADDAENNLIASGAIPADQIPLIIEDKTFVPANIAQQDAKWDTTNWGQPGDLWFPHVYETNQDPASIDGTNPVGRWDFGPWFWPIFPATQPLPNGSYGSVSSVPDSFQDTPVINGTAYPTLTVDPKAYRFRILNASNDRYLNLGLYKADATPNIAPQLNQDGNPIVDANGNQRYFTDTEVKMVPATADAGGNALLPPAGTYVDANCQCEYPNLTQLNNSAPSGPTRAWPTDGRLGGAPDPALVGPDFIAIGNDGGFLPNPVDIPSQPITYEANRRSITVSNIYGYGLLLGPSERADAIVDFSAYAGQTLILYNDAPAPVPFNDQRLDYYTGNPDLTGNGGAYSTLPGYGPNTRTMMQIKVSNATPAPAFNANALVTALPAAYAASQARPIVPAVAYNAAFKTNDTDIYAHVATGSVAQPTLDFSSGAITINGLNLVTSSGAGSGSGTGYDPLNPPIVTFNNTVNNVDCLYDPVTKIAGVSATATAVVDPVTRQVTGITGFNGGSGYVCAPTVTFTNPPGTSGVGAQAAVVSANATFQSIPVYTKAEQELFNASGRYNYTGGVEMPFTNAINQTTVPLNYIDSATEVIADGETQIWKIVVNGLFSNSIHFGFVEVQLINRVGWDGTVKAPASNEVGWKDTLRLNPLEDMVIAVRAKRASVPFGLPRSSRLQDPSVKAGAAGSGLGFTVDPLVVSPTNVPLLTTSTNVVANYDNEFAWYSAILSHSEDDLMRPIVFHANVVKPDAPSNWTDTKANGAYTLGWTDPTPAATSLANPKNEIGLIVKRATYTASGNLGAYGVGTALLANVTSFTDATQAAGTDYAYQVTAWNAAGSTIGTHSVINSAAPATPAGFALNGAITNGSVGLRWNAVAGAGRYLVTATNMTNPAAAPVNYTTTQTTYTLSPALALGSVYSLTVSAQKVRGDAALSSAPSAAVTADLTLPNAPVAPTATIVATTTLTLNWTAAAGAVTYTVQRANNAAFTGAVTTIATGLTGLSRAVTGLTGNTSYYFRVLAVNGVGSVSGSSSAVVLTTPVAPSGVSRANGTGGAPITAGLNWTTVAGFTYNVMWGTAAQLTANTGTVVASTSGAQIAVPGPVVSMKVQAVNGTGGGAWSASTTVTAQ